MSTTDILPDERKACNPGHTGRGSASGRMASMPGGEEEKPDFVP